MAPKECVCGVFLMALTHIGINDRQGDERGTRAARFGDLIADAAATPSIRADSKGIQIGYYGHPDHVNQEWLDKELEREIPSEEAIETCCNVENEGPWQNMCTIFEAADTWCHYTKKCWKLLRKLPIAYYEEKPHSLYQMVADGAKNKYKVADYVDCSLRKYRFEPVLSACIVRSVCQRYIERHDPPGFQDSLGDECRSDSSSFKITKNRTVSAISSCIPSQEMFKLTALDCMRTCHKFRLNQVRPCATAVFGPNERCTMYADRTVDQGGVCKTSPVEDERTLIELRKDCQIR
uniref:Uncharacterized protein n=1 Tax=Plectus sambesii TaxID=2011161 RepID=A0A914WQK7_9BILA